MSNEISAEYIKAQKLDRKIKASAYLAQQSLYDMCIGFKEMRDTKLLKQINKTVKRDWADIIDEVDQTLLKNALSNHIVYDYIMHNSDIEELKNMMRSHR